MSIFYGNHFQLCLLLLQITIIQYNETAVYFNVVVYTYMYITLFGLYLGHSQTRQYKSHTKKDTKSKWPLFGSHYLNTLRTGDTDLRF